MPDKKVLLIANSVYQLFTAVHLRLSILKDCHAEILLTDITPQMKEDMPRLVGTKLFDRVLFGQIKDFNRQYMQGNTQQITDGYQNSEQLFRFALGDTLAKDYDAVYFANFDTFVRMLAYRLYEQPCRFICYEDGFSSYVINFLREDRAAINRHPDGIKIKDKLECVMLYEPHLAMRQDGVPNVRLPKIDRNNERLRTVLNTIFDYQPPTREVDFVFLEQSFRAEGIRTNDIELMQICQQTVGAGRFAVKPHPRNTDNLPFQLGLTRKYPTKVPWELYLFNADMRGKTIITVCSNAALTGRIVFNMDINTVMLYPLFEGKVLWQEDAALFRYLKNFERQFAGRNYYAPKTLFELENILHYLGGHHERTS